MRNIALEGKITIIKTLALSKTVYLTLIQIQKKTKKPSFGTTWLPKSNMKLCVTLVKKVWHKFKDYKYLMLMD